MPSRVLFGFLLIDLAAAALSHSDVCFQPHSKVMEDVNHGHQYLSACSSHLRQGKQIFGIGKEEILLLIGRSGRSLRCSDYGVHLSGWCKVFFFLFFFTVTSDPMRFRRLRDDPTAVTTDVSFSFLSENNTFFLMWAFTYMLNLHFKCDEWLLFYAF